MRTLIGLTALMLLVACGSGPSADLHEIVGTSWRLTELDGQPPIRNYVPIVEFNEGSLGGTTGLNRFTAPWEFVEDKFRCGPFAMTRVAGSEEQMNQESLFTIFLESEPSVMIDDTTLTFTQEDGSRMVLTRNR